MIGDNDHMGLVVQAKEQHLNDLVMMGLDLWPDEDHEGLKTQFSDILQSEKNKILLFSLGEERVAFIYLSVRTDYVEGSESSPTGYVEGLYVKPKYRRMGISRKLLHAGEQWLKEKGCKQIGSDTYLDNKVSYDFHTSVGFKEAGRLIAFIKNLK